jgi:adenosylmethionine-8-amino-7-oxononanoate aminotransferase
MTNIIFPYASNDQQPIRKIEHYTEYGFIENGEEYLDLSLGACGCFPLGFKRQDIIESVTKKMILNPFCGGEFYTTNQAVLDLTDKIYQLSGGYKSAFALSGSDAVEGALRLAQMYNGRKKFLGFRKSYHGSTYLSSSVSDATYMTDIFGKDTRCIVSDYNLDLIDNDLCAVIIETASWQNGLYDPGETFWKDLRKTCTDKDIVLIVDDIAMCGGKTGKFFGWQDRIVPDVFTMGKALTGGYFPLSAVCANQKIFDRVKHDVFVHGFSYSFSLSGIYSALEYIKILEQEKLLDNQPKLESWAKKMCQRFKDGGLIKDYTNYGLLFNLVLLNEKPMDNTFERFLYQYGINAGMWNEGGNGVLFVVPLDAPASWFEEIEFRFTTALLDYRSNITITNNV